MGGDNPVSKGLNSVNQALDNATGGQHSKMTYLVDPLDIAGARKYGAKKAAADESKANWKASANALLADATIDITTKNEIQNALNQDNEELFSSNALVSAKLGEGMYGIRRKNTELVKMLIDQPGRRQTLLTDQGNPQTQTAQETILPGGGR